MGKNSKQTTKDIASLAAKTLREPNASEIAKQLAGAALSQSSTNKQTGDSMETILNHFAKHIGLQQFGSPVSISGVEPTK